MKKTAAETIPSPMFADVTVRIVGTTPLVINNWRNMLRRLREQGRDGCCRCACCYGDVIAPRGPMHRYAKSGKRGRGKTDV